MAAQSTTTSGSHLLSTHRALVETLTSFLTVAAHHILYLRRLYPPISFLSTRAYNYPVRQNRHPAVCNWILDAVAAIRDQLEKNTVEKVALCIYECETNKVLERWTFDLHSLPAVARRDRDIPFGPTHVPPNSSVLASDKPESTTTPTTDLALARTLNLTDLEAHFRATLSRISTAAARLHPLPEGPGAPECSFTLAIEVKDGADRPVGRLDKEERRWMAAEPDETNTNTTTTTTSTNNENSNHQTSTMSPHSAQTHAIRRLEAGELRIEVWVEEAAAKFAYINNNNSLHPSAEATTSASSSAAAAAAAERRTKMSYGAGTDRFDPELGDGAGGYDLEPPDVNRKPQGGATTDYQRP